MVVSHGAALQGRGGRPAGLADRCAASLRGLDNCGWAALDDGGPTVPLRLVAYNRTVATAPDFASAARVG